MPQFIPTVYASQLLTELRRNTVASQITNSNYTGEISERGDTVKVHAVGDLSVNDHTKGSKVTWQNPSGSDKTLVIDQQKDVSFLISDIDQFQSAIDVRAAYRRKQAQAFAENLDDHVLGMHSDAPAANVIDTTASTASGFIKQVRNAKVALSDQNVPRMGRYMVLSPFYASLVAEYYAEQMTNEDAARSGYVGRLEGFDCFESTAVPEVDTGTDGTADKQKLIFGQSEAITLASQIVNAELVESHPDYHAGGWKGLLVYGAKTFVPEALGVLNADVPA